MQLLEAPAVKCIEEKGLIEERMKNLIEYIAHAKGLGKEKLATEILAEIVRSPIADYPFREYMSHFCVGLPFWYSVRTQEGGMESRGIPDLWIRDELGNPLVIIECKFNAGFTVHQPNSYLNEIESGGLLLFIVPDKRLDSAFRELRERCNSEVKLCTGRPRQAEINGRHLVVSSWGKILHALDADQKPLGSRLALDKYNVYLNELKGFCDVASKEVFPPLTEEQIKGIGIAGVIHQLKWLVENIIKTCIEDEILEESPSPKEKQLYAGYDSSLFLGREMQIGNQPVWIGFYGSAWEERAQSPLWIQIVDRDHKATQLVAKLRRQKGDDLVVPHTFDSGEAFVIPIPITPGLSQAEVVTSACQFVASLKRLMTEP
jgi:hypothetical protein